MDAAGSEPLTQAAFFQRQASEAWQAGQAALRDGDLQQALVWHERAWRLAPDDPTTALALAAARLRNGATQNTATARQMRTASECQHHRG